LWQSRNRLVCIVVLLGYRMYAGYCLNVEFADAVLGE
jgi:hypothetical protein